MSGFRAAYSPKRPPAAGIAVVTVAAGIGTLAVSFPAGYFSVAPVVVASMDGGNFDWIASASAITTSGFTLTVAQRSGSSGSGSVGAKWIAVNA